MNSKKMLEIMSKAQKKLMTLDKTPKGINVYTVTQNGPLKLIKIGKTK